MVNTGWEWGPRTTLLDTRVHDSDVIMMVWLVSTLIDCHTLETMAGMLVIQGVHTDRLLAI